MRRKLVVAGLACVMAGTARAQDTSLARVTLDDRGLVFSAPARATEVALRFYVQPLITLQGDDDAGALRRVGMQIRRARVSLAGTVWDPRLRFNFQFGLSRQDIDLETIGVTGTLADALVTWNWTPRFYTAIGQAKIYGNRQSLTSVSEIEFPERSIVSTTFALDRDAGVLAGYTHALGKGPAQLRAAITSGEGRNSALGDTKLAYTARFDWQPLGPFKGNGAFSESDLLREPNTRLAVGTSYSFNEGATRVGGQTGAVLFAPRDMRTLWVDATLKRRGFALLTEYARRESSDPVTTSAAGDSRAVFAGYGITAQASYVTRGGFLPAMRVSSVVPDEAIYGVSTARRRLQSSIELAKFLRGHRLKWQVELGRDDSRDPVTHVNTPQLFSRLSVLAGI